MGKRTKRTKKDISEKGDIKKRPTVKNKNEEHEIQSAVFEWRDAEGLFIFPELCLYHSITSGQPRYGWQVGWYKREGMMSGLPDTHLPVPRGGYTSLWIEFKSPTGTVRPEQKDAIALLRRYRNLVVICRSKEEAIQTLTDYLLCRLTSPPD